MRLLGLVKISTGPRNCERKGSYRCARTPDRRTLMGGHHPVAHGKAAPATPQEWTSYWTDYYNRSRQLKKASQESWNATQEIWKRKLVQARRIRCQKCIEIVKLWLRTYGYGPERLVLKENLSQRARTKRTTF